MSCVYCWCIVGAILLFIFLDLFKAWYRLMVCEGEDIAESIFSIFLN